jgi:hypothetical protein
VGELAPERSKSSCIAKPKTPCDLLLLVLRLATSKEEPSTVHGAGVVVVPVPIVESGNDQSLADEDRNMWGTERLARTFVWVIPRVPAAELSLLITAVLIVMVSRDCRLIIDAKDADDNDDSSQTVPGIVKVLL